MYPILCKELAHPRIVVSTENPGTKPQGMSRDSCTTTHDLYQYLYVHTHTHEITLREKTFGKLDLLGIRYLHMLVVEPMSTAHRRQASTI